MRQVVAFVIFLCLLGGCFPRDNGCLDHLPDELPWRLGVDGITFDSSLVIEAARWWDERLGYVAFVSSEDDVNLMIREYYADVDWEEIGISEPIGLYRPLWAIEGRTTDAEIIISPSISYHDEMVLEVLKHELGHALGLRDDPWSIDLNSIMCSPLILGADVTNQDLRLLQQGCPMVQEETDGGM